MAPKPIYTPPKGLRTKLDDFRDYVNGTHKVQLKTYHDLHDFSVTRLNDFWMSIWNFAGVKASEAPAKAIDDYARIDQFPHFFEDAKINFAENMLCGKDDAVAVIEMNETNIHKPRKYTWKDLRQLVARYKGVLVRAGVKEGDVVVLVGGNSARSLAFLLAAAAIGAMFASFATDMGDKSLLDRVGQLQPAVIVAELQYRYNGKIHDIRRKIHKCAQKVAENRQCQLLVTETRTGQALPASAQRLDSLVQQESANDLTFASLPFNTPFVIMFSSGTTGLPKGIVHRQGGLMINGMKQHLLHNNFGPQDIHFHFSGIGWTLWNISIGAMFCQTAMVLYDGSPFYPNPDVFLRAVFATGVTGYGGSPRYFSELQKSNVRPREYVKSMHTLLSTGALLTPGTASWLAEAFGPVCQVGFTGGTELCGNFAGGTRSMPCYPGEIAVKELGMDVDVFGPDGRSVPVGEPGELVCKKPFPNMPVFFWNDPKFERYRKAYFEGFPGVWTHGDLIKISPETKGIYVLGRSDGVLNPSGVRFGSSDLYNILASPALSSKVFDGLAVGQQRQTSKHSDPAERVILFLKVAPDYSTGRLAPDTALLNDVKAQIMQDLSRRHVPHFFFEVDEIPHNANGKKMEIQVKQICNGGKAALDKMTLSDVERSMLMKFVKFHEVENVTEKQQSKL